MAGFEEVDEFLVVDAEAGGGTGDAAVGVVEGALDEAGFVVFDGFGEGEVGIQRGGGEAVGGGAGGGAEAGDQLGVLRVFEQVVGAAVDVERLAAGEGRRAVLLKEREGGRAGGLKRAGLLGGADGAAEGGEREVRQAAPGVGRGL